MVIKASKLLKIVYCLTLLGTIYPAGVAASRSWIGLVFGGGPFFLWPRLPLLLLILFGSRIIYVIARPGALDVYASGIITKAMRTIAIFFVYGGFASMASLFFVKPITLTLFKSAGENGIGYFAVGLYLVMLSSAGIAGIILFEIVRFGGELAKRFSASSAVATGKQAGNSSAGIEEENSGGRTPVKETLNDKSSGRSKFTSPLEILLIVVIAAFAIVVAATNLIHETISWDEDVLLMDGRILPVHRTIAYEKDGHMNKQTLNFLYKGNKMKWVTKYDKPFIDKYSMPDILDFVNDMPVLVFPVHRWEQCKKYNFPQEGIVGFGYRNGNWERIAVTDLPKELKINLLRSTHEIRYWSEYKGKKIEPNDKYHLESNTGCAKQGSFISNDYYTKAEESCANMHPLPNPQLDALKRQNAEAEMNAKTLTAKLLSSPDSSENIPREDFLKAKGRWTGHGYLSPSCKGIVGKIDPIRQYSDRGWSLKGCDIVLQNGNHIPLQQLNIKTFQAPEVPDSVVCNKESIYAVKRKGKEITVFRIAPAGILIDVSNIVFSDIDKYYPEKDWPEILIALPEKDKLDVTFAENIYSKNVEINKTFERLVHYRIQFPQK